MTNTALVCRVCGYSEDERREQGCIPGTCRIPREVGKPNSLCAMNKGAYLCDDGEKSESDRFFAPRTKATKTNT
jgi:hypothetical protein